VISDEIPGLKRVEQFRGQRNQAPLHPAEKALLAVLGVHLCFLPWALGTMHPWSQLVSLGLAVVGFSLALQPRTLESEPGWSGGPFRVPMWPRLVRFPIFWIGLALLVYVTVQGLNPSWRYTRNETSWWLVRVADVPWLPTSIDSPFAQASAWRQLVIYASAWMVACSAWVGITRRRSCRILLGVLVANAMTLGALLVFQRVTDDLRVPWPLTALTKAELAASFIYRNHTGAYLALMTFTAIALATWGYDQGARTLKKSTPAAVLAMVAFFLSGTVLFTFSRGATLVLGGLLVVYTLWFFMRRRVRPAAAGATDARITLVLVLMFGGFALYVGRNLDFTTISTRFHLLIEEPMKDESVSRRLEARAAGLTMLVAHGWRGIGAGGFRFLFPQYVRAYPDIYDGGKLFWEHQHNDWLEIPEELGAAGTLLLLAGAGYWAAFFLRRRALWHSSLVPLLFGCAGTLLHAWIDFPFQCPAILVTWCLVLTLAARGLSLEERGG
jgi:O-antigen ligase